MTEPAERLLSRVVQTCHGHPSQWDAWTVDGRYLYLRYRHGEGSVERHPGPDTDTWTDDSWNEGRSELLVEWDDGTDGGVISLADFLSAAGLGLAPGASIT
ncbi:hypothetical protein ACFWVC_27075 [Streptomyces sp. NPDC058691]|uniref:hypothetical protein n=1 Tax=Streptomyces sp. NPDC058691 TaxID=3346601 RepID=UPI00365CC352